MLHENLILIKIIAIITKAWKYFHEYTVKCYNLIIIFITVHKNLFTEIIKAYNTVGAAP